MFFRLTSENMKKVRYFILSAVVITLVMLYWNYTEVAVTNPYKDKNQKRVDNTRLFDPLPYCEYFTAGPTPVAVNETIPAWKELEQRFTWLQNGGYYKPTGCRAYQNTAIIVPYRNREEHLKLFLQHMHPFLQAQDLEYTIYVAELEKSLIWRKGALMNAGFIEASSFRDHDCYIFHDVDMLPMDAMISYRCLKDIIKHPPVYMKRFNFTRLGYQYNKRGVFGYFGGVLLFPPDMYRKVNGFSNVFVGWGGEDDDMLRRAVLVDLAVARMERDGLNSVEYDVIQVDKTPLYTRLYILTNKTQSRYYVMKPQTKATAIGGWKYMNNNKPLPKDRF